MKRGAEPRMPAPAFGRDSTHHSPASGLLGERSITYLKGIAAGGEGTPMSANQAEDPSRPVSTTGGDWAEVKRQSVSSGATAQEVVGIVAVTDGGSVTIKPSEPATPPPQTPKAQEGKG